MRTWPRTQGAFEQAGQGMGRNIAVIHMSLTRAQLSELIAQHGEGELHHLRRLSKASGTGGARSGGARSGGARRGGTSGSRYASRGRGSSTFNSGSGSSGGGAPAWLYINILICILLLLVVAYLVLRWWKHVRARISASQDAGTSQHNPPSSPESEVPASNGDDMAESPGATSAGMHAPTGMANGCPANRHIQPRDQHVHMVHRLHCCINGAGVFKAECVYCFHTIYAERVCCFHTIYTVWASLQPILNPSSIHPTQSALIASLQCKSARCSSHPLLRVDCASGVGRPGGQGPVASEKMDPVDLYPSPGSPVIDSSTAAPPASIAGAIQPGSPAGNAQPVEPAEYERPPDVQGYGAAPAASLRPLV
jgi:hypothetical protein